MSKGIMLMEINQPIGSFYIGKISSEDLIKISKVIPRKNNIGTQRQLQEMRVKEIAKYCDDPDATFPTPIVLSIRSEDVKSIKETSISGVYELNYDDDLSGCVMRIKCTYCVWRTITQETPAKITHRQ